MDNFELVLRNARYIDALPSEITDKIDQWERICCSKEDDSDSEECIKEELVNDIAVYLWTTKKMNRLGEYASKFEGTESKEDNIFLQLKELHSVIERTSDICKKEYLYAQGFCLLSEFDIAKELLEKCTRNKETNNELLIEVRELLADILSFCGATWKQKDENKREMIALYDFDLTECMNYLKSNFFYHNEEVENFILEILRRHNTNELWDIFYENDFRKTEYLVNVYEKIKPEIPLADGVYLEVLNYWLEKREYQKIDAEIERISNCFDDSLALKKFKVKELIEQELVDLAAELTDEILLLNENDLQIILYKIQVLFYKNDYLKTLEWIEKYQDKFDVNYIFWKKEVSLVKLDRTEEAIAYFAECYNTRNLEEIFITSLIANKEIPENVMICILDRLTAQINLEKDWITPSIFVPYVFGITENLENKGRIRYYLIELYQCVQMIKRLLTIDPEEVKEVYHYSQPETLCYLPKYSKEIGGAKLRLGNVAYLNDPEEGRVFYDILKNSNCSVLEELLDNNELMYENTYLACFSRKDDFLPMWVQYSKDGSGNCYAIDTSVFNKYESELEERLIRKVTYDRYKDKKNNYVLYRVFYYGGSQSSEEDNAVLSFCEKISSILNKLKQFFGDYQIKELTNQLLNGVRYLFKNVAYASEDEVRVICTDYFNEKCVQTCDTGVPRFYMEINEDLFFTRVILGPKAIDVKKKVTYLSCCENVGKVEQSRIKYV